MLKFTSKISNFTIQAVARSPLPTSMPWRVTCFTVVRFDAARHDYLRWKRFSCYKRSRKFSGAWKQHWRWKCDLGNSVCVRLGFKHEHEWSSLKNFAFLPNRSSSKSHRKDRKRDRDRDRDRDRKRSKQDDKGEKNGSGSDDKRESKTLESEQNGTAVSAETWRASASGHARFDFLTVAEANFTT